MQMSDFDICQAYRQAKHPRNMIHVLADLNAVPPRDIIGILERGGENVKRSKKRGGSPKYSVDSLPPYFSDIVRQYDRGEITKSEAANMCKMTPNGFGYWEKKYHDGLIELEGGLNG